MLSDVEMAYRFFDVLYSSIDPPDDLWLTISHSAGGSMHTDWFPLSELRQAAERAIEVRLRRDVWFGVALRTGPPGGRGGAAQCALIPALWLDVDIERPGHHRSGDPLPIDTADALSLLDSKPPSLVVHSGGGLQPYWLIPPTRPEPELLNRWHQHWSTLADARGWGLDKVSDAARMMRVPGTLNHKVSPPVPVSVLTWG